MARYTDDSRDRVLDAVDMVTLVSARTELRRAGVNSYFGRCPFHEERTGSFHVSPDEKLYHCFGCQASGNPFTFVMETEGLDFKGTLESLAQRFNVTLTAVDEDPEAATRRQRRERLHALLDRAATYYARYLWEAGEAAGARGYLLGRGLSEAALRAFRVGYAPSAWERILDGSRRAGFTEDELQAVGLVQRSERTGKLFDRFRERLMFPAVDARGRVHGFGARRMREDQQPKYLNTSEGEIYHKREVLFGIDRARAAAAQTGRMILVEGYTDVLALHQAGIRNAVGIMGTSLTEEQVAELERVVQVLELCLDADRAGQDAMVRAARLADGRNLELRVVALPEGADPADLVEREGPDALRRLVDGSIPFVAFDVQRILDRSDTRTAEGRDQALGELAPAFGALGPSVLRDDLVRRVAGRLELSESRLVTLLGNGGRRRARSAENGAGDGSRPATGGGGGGGGWGGLAGAPAQPVDMAGASPGVRSERLFLALCIAVPDQGVATLRAIEVDQLLTSGPLRAAAQHLAANDLRAPLAHVAPDDEPLARTLAGLVELAGRVPDPSGDRLQHARQLLELERLERAIIRARAEGAGTSALAREREGVRAGMREVIARLESTL